MQYILINRITKLFRYFYQYTTRYIWKSWIHFNSKFSSFLHFQRFFASELFIWFKLIVSWLSTIPKNRKVKPSSLQSCAQVLVLSRHVWFHGSSQSVVSCKLVVYHVGIGVSWKQCVVSFMHNIFDCFLVNLIQFLSRKEKQTYLCFWKFEYNLSK